MTMAGKIKAIIKKPGEPYGHMTHISPSLENLQKHVGGYIQAVSFGALTIICNEDGKLKGLPKNFRMGYFDTFVGTVVVVGSGEEDFTDIPITFTVWKQLLDGWGN
jgi:hypothetical protein